MRPTELADQLQITKQSVNDLLGYLEAHGYLIREPDPIDSRSRRIHWTDRGQQLEWLVANIASNLDQTAAEFLGQERQSRRPWHRRSLSVAVIIRMS